MRWWGFWVDLTNSFPHIWEAGDKTVWSIRRKAAWGVCGPQFLPLPHTHTPTHLYNIWGEGAVGTGSRWWPMGGEVTAHVPWLPAQPHTNSERGEGILPPSTGRRGSPILPALMEAPGQHTREHMVCRCTLTGYKQPLSFPHQDANPLQLSLCVASPYGSVSVQQFTGPQILLQRHLNRKDNLERVEYGSRW
jgi:hypothetical protein